MKTIFKHMSYYTPSILKNLHKNALPSLLMILSSFAYCRRPIISQLARLLAQIYPINYMYQRLCRFLAHTKSEIETICKDISEILLMRLEDKHIRSVQISLDGTQGGEFHILALIIPIKGSGKAIYYKWCESYDLKDRMRQHEKELIEGIHSVVEPQLRYKIIFVADRGFAQVEVIKRIEELGGKWIIRCGRG